MSPSRLLKGAVLGSLLTVCIVLPAAAPASAGVLAQVSQSSQRMRVYVDGVLAFDWPVSTARRGYVTPNGSYRVGLMAPMWRSRKYNNAPMPHAMFFHGGYAIHGTYAVGHLGRRASHGCVRLSPRNAQALYHLAKGSDGTRVVIRN